MKKMCILALAFVLAGCAAKTTVTNLPPGVSNQAVNDWMNASTDLQHAQAMTHGALTSVIALNHSTPQVIPDGVGYTTVLYSVGRAEQIEIEAAQFLNTVPNNWSASTAQKINDYTAQILAQLAAANASGILGVKDPATGAAVSETISNIMKVIQLVRDIASTPAARLAVPEKEVSIVSN